MARLQQRYQTDIVPQLMKRFAYTNKMQVPKLTKITLNMGVGTDKKQIAQASEELKLIAGQQPVVTKARKSVASFKIREGWPLGCKVTLRGKRMYEFLDRLISIALPGVRDFRGLNAKSFDGRGNYSFGLKEQIVFPEIDYDKVEEMRGLDVVVTTTAANDEEGEALLLAFNFPIKTKRGKDE